MSNKSKELRYRALIEKAKASYAPYDAGKREGELRLYWCEECQEINLWTYWQGRGCLDAKIMLVGQDWGSPWDSSADGFLSKVQAANSGIYFDYMEGNESITDNRLAELFDSIGFDITKPCPNLFFTNFILGYRNHGVSGGYSTAWQKHDKGYFRELANIIEPRVILCLGRSTFEGVLSAFDIKPKISNYNDFIENSANPVSVTLDSGETAYIFALAHCGAMGTLNRNRGRDVSAILELQMRDWARIKPFISAKNKF